MIVKKLCLIFKLLFKNTNIFSIKLKVLSINKSNWFFSKIKKSSFWKILDLKFEILASKALLSVRIFLIELSKFINTTTGLFVYYGMSSLKKLLIDSSFEYKNIK